MTTFYEVVLYGMRYIVDGDLQAPDGSFLRIRSVWFVHTGEIVPKFITAHPLKGINHDQRT